MSLPSFFLAFLLLWFSAETGLLPTGGARSPDYENLTLLGKIWDIILHLTVPALTLALVSLAGLTRLVRSAVLEVLESPMMVMLRAKGVPDRVIIKHVIKNAMNPFVTALIEIIVGWPGMGMLILDAVLSQDLFLVMGSLYIGTIMLIVGNLFADIMLSLIDPRVREREVVT